GVSKRDRDQMVSEFQQHRDRPGLMLLSLRAGGTGLTLTAANHVVHLDRWWNPAVEDQATDRAFRIGQRRDVMVNKLVSAGTVEEKIDTVLSDKQALAELTVGPGEDWMASLDDDRLFDLLSLEDEEDGSGASRWGRAAARWAPPGMRSRCATGRSACWARPGWVAGRPTPAPDACSGWTSTPARRGATCGTPTASCTRPG